ncbi:hypothetical protein Shal_2441 [Shewanella halifaxensis HAW-EB4]|uniref:Uncharacterized protein n=1 Tax=Shewanella halifaxensis (strain HAW-EB4) TaxID=458817 RepID=B0TJK3_SHEHH|nr:hypothetical protein Shal_2441 [Shewanella halifaxensis HAW-EB4]
MLIAESRRFYVGERQTFTSERCCIDVESGFVDSGLTTTPSNLLKLKCLVNCQLNDIEFNGLQEANLSPNEPVSSLVNGNEQLKITLGAKPV